MKGSNKLHKCTNCNKKKQSSEFYWKTDNPSKMNSPRCKTCVKDRIKHIADSNRDRVRDNNKISSKQYRDNITPDQKNRRTMYLEKYNLDNKQKKSEYGKSYREQYPERIAAKEAKRRSNKLSRTPMWVDRDHLSKIKSIYKMCRALSKKTGIRHEVDHIYPLQGKLVSGLHVLNNLQVISAEDNRAKSNKYTV